MKNPRNVFVTLVSLSLVLTSCDKEQEELTSNPSEEYVESKNSSQYTPLGDALIGHLPNGDVSIYNLSNSGNDGFKVNVSNYCTADFIMDEIVLNNENDFFSVAGFDDNENLIVRIGVEYSPEGNQVICELGEEVRDVEIQLWNGYDLLYTDNLDSKAFPWWPLIRWVILNNLKDFHMSSSTDIIFSEGITFTNSMSLTWGLIADPNDGGDVELPHETFFADRVTIEVKGGKKPIDFIEVNSAGVASILLTDREFDSTGGCRD